MNKLTLIIFSLLSLTTARAQVLSLDSCRAMALRSNKQMEIARVERKVAENTRKAARTKYLPQIDLVGGYMYSSREISILNDDIKSSLSNAGTLGAMAMKHLAGTLGSGFGPLGQEMVAQLALAGNALGQRIVDEFRTNTHNIYTASATLTQPVFMGGAITAGNRMADIAEKMADTNIEAKEYDVNLAIDNAYWAVVSLKHKQQLADAYLRLVQKLSDDVHKMIANGVATRADGLKVDVAVNEAEMAKTKVDNGLALARMFLCQQCGMDLDSNIILEDEDKKDLEAELVGTDYDIERAKERRPETRLLEYAIELTRQQTKIARAAYLPQVALTTSALFSNPSVYNGFEQKFKGAVNVGVMVRVPVLDWGNAFYKIRASKNATNIALLQYEEVEDMIELQINQSMFKVNEANKNLATARRNIQRAEENLRCANVGFREGVMQTTDVMAAQTAWLQAQTQKVDAEIDVKLSEAALKKAVAVY